MRAGDMHIHTRTRKTTTTTTLCGLPLPARLPEERRVHEVEGAHTHTQKQRMVMKGHDKHSEGDDRENAQ